MYMNKIISFSKANNVDVFKLVKAIGNLDTVNCDEGIMVKAVESIKDQNNSGEIEHLNALKFFDSKI